MKDFEDLEKDSIDNPERFIGNPVNSFLIIKKLTKDLQKFVDTVNAIEKLKDVVRDIKENSILPTNEDYEGSITAILRVKKNFFMVWWITDHYVLIC